MRRMRLLICGLVFAGMAPQAEAADLGDTFLRGSNSVVNMPSGDRWSGVYFGAQAGFTNGSTDFGNSVSTLISYILRNSVIQDQVAGWTALNKVSTPGVSYGGFIGYNQRWDDVIIGVEANYNRTSLKTMSASDSLSRSILNNTNAPAGHDYTYNMTVAADAAVQITDMATFRARAGWDAGIFLPYAFAGVAIGRANVSRTATVSGTLTDSFTTTQVFTDPVTGVVTLIPVQQSVTSTLVLPGAYNDSQTGMFAYGWTAGLGMDVSVTQNLFLRAEWEWVQFAPIKDMNVHMNTVRVGAALKF